MKAIVVVDMPDEVSLDEWFAVKVVVDRLKATEEELMQGIPFDESKTFKFVPLRPMPQEQDIYEIGMDEEDTNAKRQWSKGWNACLKEIEK